MGGEGEHEDPPPIAPYPFWQHGAPSTSPAPRPLPATGENRVQTGAVDDVPTETHDTLSDAPTQAHDFPTQMFDAPPPSSAPAPPVDPAPSGDPTPAASLSARDRSRVGGSAPRANRPIVVVGLVACLIVGAVLLLGGRAIFGGGEGGPDATPQPSVTAPALPGRDPADLAVMSPAAAQAALRDGDQSEDGDIVQALSWRDDNGRNAVITTQERSSGGRTTLRVVQVAGLGDDPQALRVMRDPDLPSCSSDDSPGEAGFTPRSLIVRDLDGDGIAEVISGWSSRCATGPSTVRLALVSDGDKYILRGDGVIGARDSGTTSPDPASSTWPKTFFSTLTTLFHQLYY